VEEPAVPADQAGRADAPVPRGGDAVSGDDPQAVAGSRTAARRRAARTSVHRRPADLAVLDPSPGLAVRPPPPPAAPEGRGAPDAGRGRALRRDPAGPQEGGAREARGPDQRPHRPPEPGRRSAVLTGATYFRGTIHVRHRGLCRVAGNRDGPAGIAE